MQNTRLNSLVDNLLGRLDRWLQNPWRRFSLVIISLLFGNLLATIVATTAGQTAELDSLVALLLVASTELVNWVVTRGDRLRRSAEAPFKRPLFTEMLNAVKIGLIYGMFVEAFKIGS
ncbi:MAG: DUF565 domain-containing protein [Leptolyngbyaceae cyanobacterium RM2_2_4]|nr:DUF565 domain-containing protein [Leptolyngbyaceae cyanobacterium RM2_2_4]